ncbi:hypothetical protein DL93DRAFT_412707 [Clavulina sp. PMI_390]|nr:hypothetical protein DL93DRAFT_412707 [Clavulina sp. PMI_390]
MAQLLMDPSKPRYSQLPPIPLHPTPSPPPSAPYTSSLFPFKMSEHINLLRANSTIPFGLDFPQQFGDFDAGFNVIDPSLLTHSPAPALPLDGTFAPVFSAFGSAGGRLAYPQTLRGQSMPFLSHLPSPSPGQAFILSSNFEIPSPPLYPVYSPSSSTSSSALSPPSSSPQPRTTRALPPSGASGLLVRRLAELEEPLLPEPPHPKRVKVSPQDVRPARLLKVGQTPSSSEEPTPTASSTDSPEMDIGGIVRKLRLRRNGRQCPVCDVVLANDDASRRHLYRSPSHKNHFWDIALRISKNEYVSKTQQLVAVAIGISTKFMVPIGAQFAATENYLHLELVERVACDRLESKLNALTTAQILSDPAIDQLLISIRGVYSRIIELFHCVDCKKLFPRADRHTPRACNLSQAHKRPRKPRSRVGYCPSSFDHSNQDDVHNAKSLDDRPFLRRSSRKSAPVNRKY